MLLLFSLLTNTLYVEVAIYRGLYFNWAIYEQNIALI
jgi:hypothetical protein